MLLSIVVIYCCIRWCLTILSFLVTAFVLSVLYVMSRDIKHLKRNDGYESDNSNNPGDWREWSDRDVDTPRPLPGRPTKQDEFMAGLLELMQANQLSQNRMLEEQARKDEETQQLQVRTEEERRTWEQEVQEKAHKLHMENLQMQKELEEARMQHEVKLLNLQQENDRVRKEFEEKRRLAERIPKLTEADQPRSYFSRFEESMKEADIAKKE